MFFGRGFDTDGDGDNDFFVGRRLSPQEQRNAGCLMIAVMSVVIVVGTISDWAERDKLNVWDWLWLKCAGVFIVGLICLICFGVLSSFIGNHRRERVAWIAIGVFGLMSICWSWWESRGRRLEAERVAKAQAEKQAFEDNVHAVREEILRNAREKARSR